MATEVWWIDPPRSWTAGGYMIYEEHDAQISDDIYIHNNRYFVGFQCQKEWFFPLDLVSDHYESYSYHSYVQFHLPTTASGTLTGAELYLMVGVVDILLNISASYQDIDIYYKNVMDYLDFPWDTLSENDWDDGTWTKNPTSIEDMMSLYGDFLVEGPHWITPIDVTSGIALAIGYGWDRTAFMLTPNYRKPFDWDYDNRPTPYDQKIMAGFYGAVNPYWVASPTGFPESACSPCPWLKLTYSGGTTQYVPGEDVVPNPVSGEGSSADVHINCIAADPKAKMAIAGTESGNLWYCWSGGGVWDKMIDGDEPITAVWMDYIRNFQDYPYDEIAWYGTSSGNLYKSLDSLGNFTFVKAFPTAIREIMSSNEDSDKVVVGVDDGVWVTIDGGDTWIESLEAPTEI